MFQQWLHLIWNYMAVVFFIFLSSFFWSILCYDLFQGNPICPGAEGCINKFRDVSTESGGFAYVGLWDRGSHSQSETAILRGQSGESPTPGTKGLLSLASFLLSGEKKNLRSAMVYVGKWFTYRKVCWVNRKCSAAFPYKINSTAFSGKWVAPMVTMSFQSVFGEDFQGT